MLSLLLAAALSQTPSADGVAISYEFSGSAQPALVFIHCLSCDRSYWGSTLAQLGDRKLELVALDLAGHGRSGKNRSAWSIQNFAEDVKAVSEHQHLQRVVLVGHSIGGYVAVEAAKKLPGKVAGILLVDTLLNVDDVATPQEVSERTAPFRKDYAGTMQGMSRQFLFLPTTAPVVVDRVMKSVLAMPPETAIACLEGLWTYDPRPVLRELKMPIRAINGDRFPTDAEAFQKYAPQFQVDIMKGVSHYPMLDDPSGFSALLSRSLDAILRGGEK